MISEIIFSPQGLHKSIVGVGWQHDALIMTSSLAVFKTGMYLYAFQWHRITRQSHVPIFHIIPTYSVHSSHTLKFRLKCGTNFQIN